MRAKHASEHLPPNLQRLAQCEYCVRCGILKSSFSKVHKCRTPHTQNVRPPPLPVHQIPLPVQLVQPPPLDGQPPLLPTQLAAQIQHAAVDPSSQPHVPTLVPPPTFHQARPCRTVPFAARDQWSRSVRRALEGILAAKERGLESEICEAFSALLRLPVQSLTDTQASRGRARRTRVRLQRLDADEDPNGSVEAPDAQPHTRRVDDKYRLAARAHKHLTLGSISRAAKCLEALPIADPNNETMEALRALHPIAQPPIVPHCEVAAITVTLEMFKDVLIALPKGSAPGPSGWTYEHIKAATTGEDSALGAALVIINLIVSGTLPHIPELLDSRLIGLQKPNGGGLRPIAIGEAWLRLASLCAMAACPNAGRSLAPLQLGVGVSGGSQIIGQAIAAGITADPQCVTVQLDWRNAFNSLSREAMLAAIVKRQPTLLPFAAWTYKQSSRLFVDGMPSSTPPILSQCGVRQGDPCGVLYFSLTTQDILEKVRILHPEAPILSYTDDTFLQGSAASVTAAFPTLCNHGAAIGLEARLNKCGVYSAVAQHATETAAHLGISERLDGLLVAGTPIGTNTFINTHANAKADATTSLISKLLNTPLPAQDKFIILRSSMQMRVAHLPRIAPWSLIEDALKNVEDAVVNAVFMVMERPQQVAVREGQLTLPLRFGGVGIRTTSQLEARAAFLSAAAVTESAMRAGAQQFRPFAGPLAQALREDWQVIHAAGGDLWPQGVAEMNDACIDGVLPSAQRTFSRFVAQSRYDSLITSFDVATEQGMRDVARLNGCACRAASIWLDTLPWSAALQLTDADFIASLRHRLGLTHAPANAPGVRCSCGRYMAPGDIDHAMTCTSLRGVMTLRHDILKSIWRRLANRAGVASSVEPTIRTLPGAQATAVANRPDSRGDILFMMPSGLTVADVSVIHPASTTYVHAAQTTGGAATLRDAAKIAKYTSADPNGYAFIPLSTESYGRLGKPAMGLLNTLAATAAASGVVKDTFVANALRELSIGLCRGNGALYRRALGVMARASGIAFMAGMIVPTSDVP